MTTIAYDGKTLCVDSKVSSRSAHFGNAKKLWKLRSGGYVVLAGSMDLAYAVMLWLDGRGEKPTINDKDEVVALLVEPDGTAWEYSDKLRRWPACIPWAGGSGEVIAMTAMRCGKSAREAVEIACEMDSSTGGPIQEVVINA